MPEPDEAETHSPADLRHAKRWRVPGHELIVGIRADSDECKGGDDRKRLRVNSYSLADAVPAGWPESGPTASRRSSFLVAISIVAPSVTRSTTTGLSPSRLTSPRSAARSPARPSIGTSSGRNRNGAFDQQRTLLTQRPLPRFHFGLRPLTSPSATRIAPWKSPGWALSHRLRAMTPATNAAMTIRSTPRTASSAMSNGSPSFLDRALLLLRHHSLDHGFVVLDQLARQVDDDLLDLAGESEGGVVVGG